MKKLYKTAYTKERSLTSKGGNDPMPIVHKPNKLSKGDMIGVVAPASIPNKEQAIHAGEKLKDLGFKVKFGDSLTRQWGYFAGTDEERAMEINNMFADENISAIFCICGGYGSPRIADKLDYELIKVNPKIFWGYSDITYIHIAINQRAQLMTMHGPMLSSDIGKNSVDSMTLKNLDLLLEPKRIHYTESISPLMSYVDGTVKGRLVGGNLTLLVNTLGTPYEVDTKDKLFFIEETEEEPYQIDRMLNQLKLAGKFSDAAGILLCDFNECVSKNNEPSFLLEELFQHHIVPAGKPTIGGLKVGHCSPNIALPMGAMAQLDTHKKTLDIEAPFL